MPYLNTEYLGFLMDENNLSPSQHLAVRQAINYGQGQKKDDYLSSHWCWPISFSIRQNNIGTVSISFIKDKQSAFLYMDLFLKDYTRFYRKYRIPGL